MRSTHTSTDTGGLCKSAPYTNEVLTGGWFYRARVAVLSLTLAVVCLWACQDVRARRARNEWHAPVHVGLVIVQRGAVDAHALALLRARTSELERRLASEFQRYRASPGVAMIQFAWYGPVAVSELPPDEADEGFWAKIRQNYRLWRYTRAIDAAAKVPAHELDSRIYVVVEPGQLTRSSLVEGFGEPRGRIGVARVELSVETVDLALFVATHELFHTLGATDKYDASGRTSLPFGLPEPDLVPLFPQRYVEVMARNRVVSESGEVPPQSLGELRVGRLTAEEIGWLR